MTESWRNRGRRSVWYESRFYRTNLFWEGGEFRVRDIHLFNEAYPERYLMEPVTTNWWVYDTLPALDGFTWSTADALAGIRLVELGPNGSAGPLSGGEPLATEVNETDLLIEWPLAAGGSLEIRCQPRMMVFSLLGARRRWALEMAWSPAKTPPIREVDDKAIGYEHNGFKHHRN